MGERGRGVGVNTGVGGYWCGQAVYPVEGWSDVDCTGSESRKQFVKRLLLLERECDETFQWFYRSTKNLLYPRKRRNRLSGSASVALSGQQD